MINVSVWPRPGDQETVLARCLARIIYPCNEFDTLERALGFCPASQDVLDAEHDAVHAWLATLNPISPALMQIARLIGTLLARGLPEQVDELREIDAEILEALCARAAFEGMAAGINALAQDGLVSLARLA